jgi:hypothetical protein
MKFISDTFTLKVVVTDYEHTGVCEHETEANFLLTKITLINSGITYNAVFPAIMTIDLLRIREWFICLSNNIEPDSRILNFMEPNLSFELNSNYTNEIKEITIKLSHEFTNQITDQGVIILRFSLNELNISDTIHYLNEAIQLYPYKKQYKIHKHTKNHIWYPGSAMASQNWIDYLIAEIEGNWTFSDKYDNWNWAIDNRYTHFTEDTFKAIQNISIARRFNVLIISKHPGLRCFTDIQSKILSYIRPEKFVYDRGNNICHIDNHMGEIPLFESIGYQFKRLVVAPDLQHQYCEYVRPNIARNELIINMP